MSTKFNNTNQSWELEKSVSDECDRREREKGSYRNVWESEADTKGNIYLMGDEDDDGIVTTKAGTFELLAKEETLNFQPKSWKNKKKHTLIYDGMGTERHRPNSFSF